MPNVLNHCSAQNPQNNVLYKWKWIVYFPDICNKDKKNHKGIVKVCSVSQHGERPTNLSGNLLKIFCLHFNSMISRITALLKHTASYPRSFCIDFQAPIEEFSGWLRILARNFHCRGNSSAAGFKLIFF